MTTTTIHIHAHPHPHLHVQSTPIPIPTDDGVIGDDDESIGDNADDNNTLTHFCVCVSLSLSLSPCSFVVIGINNTIICVPLVYVGLPQEHGFLVGLIVICASHLYVVTTVCIDGVVAAVVTAAVNNIVVITDATHVNVVA